MLVKHNYNYRVVQFNGKVLDICMYILEISGLRPEVWGNPVLLVRKLTAMVRSTFVLAFCIVYGVSICYIFNWQL
jgi:hypothetical protein